MSGKWAHAHLVDNNRNNDALLFMQRWLCLRSTKKFWKNLKQWVSPRHELLELFIFLVNINFTPVLIAYYVGEFVKQYKYVSS